MDGVPPGGVGWGQWRLAMFGDPYLVWHEGPDFSELRRAVGSDPGTVRDMLRTGIELGDPLAAQSIADLAGAGLAPAGSRELLEAATRRAAGTFLVRVAQALHALTGDASWADPIVAVLAGAASPSARIDAALALPGFPATRKLVEALTNAVCDPEYLVRYHAADGLLRCAGRGGTISDHRGLFTRIAGDSSPAAWRQAAEELRAAVR